MGIGWLTTPAVKFLGVGFRAELAPFVFGDVSPTINNNQSIAHAARHRTRQKMPTAQ
jgi:hypothetical protein